MISSFCLYMKHINIEKHLESLEKMPCKGEVLTLDRIRLLLQKLGNPEKKLKGIHIAGTNGKGSVSSMLQGILTSSGHKVGLFTSPHLMSYTERFRIGYKDISEKELLCYIKKVKRVIDGIKKENGNPPTVFEALTVIGILYFADQNVEFAIFETGLGGRGDATNILDLGIEIITNVSLEHTEILGSTKMEILKEKAEIIKENSSVITACTGKRLQDYIKNKCKERNADLQIVGRDIKTRFIKMDWNGVYFDVMAGTSGTKDLHLKLLGKHQIDNAACVIGAVNILNKKGYKISNENIRDGLKNVLWKARFQTVSKEPIIIVDSAHNPAGIKSLTSTYKCLTGKKAIVLFNVKKNKDSMQMLKNLNGIASEIIFVDMPEVDIIYRARSLRRKYKNKKYSTSKSFNIAMNRAIEAADKSKGPIIICGSIYFVGKILNKL